MAKTNLAALPEREWSDPAGQDEALLSQARILADELQSIASEHDRTGECPVEALEKLFRAGLLAVPIPTHLGGHGGGLALAQTIVAEIARGEPATALILAMHYSNLAAITRGEWPASLGERIIQDSLTRRALINAAQVEPGIGSPSHGGIPETIARADGDHWRISGAKRYCTGAPALAWITVLATTDEPDRRIGSFLVPADAPGLEIVETWNAAGMRATASHDIRLSDVIIPREHLISARAVGTPAPRGNAGSAWHFSLIASVYQGIARAARDWLVAFAKNHHLATAGGTLAQQPFFRNALGEIEVRLELNARILRSLGQEVDSGRATGLGGPIVRHGVIDNAIAVTGLALEIAGNIGLSRDNPLERHHRDALCARAHAPNNGQIRGMAADLALRTG